MGKRGLRRIDPGHGPAQGLEVDRGEVAGQGLGALHHEVDELVGEPLQIVGPRIPAVPRRHARVEGLLERREGLRLDRVQKRLAEVSEGAERLLALVDGTRIGDDEGEGGLSLLLGREALDLGHLEDEGVALQRVGRIGQEVPGEADRLGRDVVAMKDRPGEDLGPHLVKSQLERGDDPEVAAAPTQRPEKVRVLVLAGAHPLAGRRHHVRRDDVVEGEAVHAMQVSAAPSQGGTAHPDGGDRRTWNGEPERLGLVIEGAPLGPSLDPRHPAVRIHVHPGHEREVDEEAAVSAAVARVVVAAPLHREKSSGLPGAIHGGHDVGRSRTPGNRLRPPVIERVPRRARRFVPVLVGLEHPAAHSSAEGIEGRGVEARRRCHGGSCTGGRGTPKINAVPFLPAGAPRHNGGRPPTPPASRRPRSLRSRGAPRHPPTSTSRRWCRSGPR